MKNETVQVTDTNVKIHHDLRTDIGKQIEWVAAGGTVRIHEEQDRIGNDGTSPTAGYFAHHCHPS